MRSQAPFDLHEVLLIKGAKFPTLFSHFFGQKQINVKYRQYSRRFAYYWGIHIMKWIAQLELWKCWPVAILLARLLIDIAKEPGRLFPHVELDRWPVMLPFTILQTNRHQYCISINVRSGLRYPLLSSSRQGQTGSRYDDMMPNFSNLFLTVSLTASPLNAQLSQLDL